MEDLKSYEPKWGKPMSSELFNGETLYTFPLPGSGPVINFIVNLLDGYKIHEHSFEHDSDIKLMYHRLVEAFKFGFAKRTKLGDEVNPEVVETLADLASEAHADHIRSIINDNKTYNDSEHYGTSSSVLVDHGTGHISILAPNGDAVALTTTINYM